jgi:hypothetical protein
MYDTVTAKVKCNNNILTNTFAIHRGVKQGDILSPLLINIFINDAIHLFNETECDPPSLTLKTVGCLFYADDLVILSTSEAGLQKSLNKLDHYCQSWKLSVNYSKSKVLCFSRQGKKIKETFTINGQVLESVQTYTYRGLEISSPGKFVNAQNNLCAKAIKATFKLKIII